MPLPSRQVTHTHLSHRSSHPSSSDPLYRDMFGSEERLKNKRRQQRWQCNKCEKEFISEYYIDRHIDTRHRRHSHSDTDSEDMVCLAYDCDILRCQTDAKLFQFCRYAYLTSFQCHHFSDHRQSINFMGLCLLGRMVVG